MGTAGYIGIIDWRKEYTGTQSSNYLNAFTGVACDSSGYIYATGYCHNTTSLFDWITIKYNPFNGQTIWAKEYGGSNGDIPNDIVIGRGNYVYVAGHYQPASGIQGVLVIKYDSSGDTVWTGYYDEGSGRYFEVTEMAVDTSGNVYATGYVGSAADYFVMKFLANGNFSWVQYYNGPGNSTDQPWAIALDNIGTVYASGSSYGTNGTTDYCTVKYDTYGNNIWAARYEGPGNGTDDAYDLAVDDSGFVYVTGVSYGGSVSGTFDCTTIKYREIIVDIEEENTSKRANVRACKLKICPNPFSGQTTLCTTLEQRAKSEEKNTPDLLPLVPCLQIYDATGRLVKSFSHLPTTQSLNNEIMWFGDDDAGNALPAGIYFCRLQNGNAEVTEKLMKIR